MLLISVEKVAGPGHADTVDRRLGSGRPGSDTDILLKKITMPSYA